jgi:hypothetical protein
MDVTIAINCGLRVHQQSSSSSRVQITLWGLVLRLRRVLTRTIATWSEWNLDYE